MTYTAAMRAQGLKVKALKWEVAKGALHEDGLHENTLLLNIPDIAYQGSRICLEQVDLAEVPDLVHDGLHDEVYCPTEPDPDFHDGTKGRRLSLEDLTFIESVMDEAGWGERATAAEMLGEELGLHPATILKYAPPYVAKGRR